MRVLSIIAITLLACSPEPSSPTASMSQSEASSAPPAVVLATPSAPPAASLTCVPVPTPENPEPSHAPVNGQPDLDVPARMGVVLVQIRQCRDIVDVLQRYGLSGPAVRYIPGVTHPESATRWFVISVPVGTESGTVVRLYAHPEDIEYVQLMPSATATVP